MDMPYQDRMIGEITYRVSALPMGKWISLEATVAKVLGPALGELFVGAKGGIAALLAGEIETDALGSAIYRITSGADEATQLKVISLLESATKTLDSDGQDHHLGADHWPRHMRDLAPWLAFALEVQLGDFISGFVAALPGVEGSGVDQSRSG